MVDLHLGGQDGLWLIQRLRALVDRTTVLALVTGTDLTGRLQARIDEAGADVALPKQDLATALPRMLERCVRSRRTLLTSTA